MDGKVVAYGPRGVRWAVAAQRVLSVVLVVVLLVLIVVHVAARYVFDAPLPWTEEVGAFLLIWLAFVAGGFVMGEGAHISVDVIGRWVGRRGRVAVECFSAAVAAGVAVVVVIAAVPFAWQMMDIRTASAGIPRGLFLAAAPLGLAMMGFHAVVNAAVAVRRGEPVWAENIGAEAELGADLAEGLRGDEVAATPLLEPGEDRERRP